LGKEKKPNGWKPKPIPRERGGCTGAGRGKCAPPSGVALGRRKNEPKNPRKEGNPSLPQRETHQGRTIIGEISDKNQRGNTAEFLIGRGV